MPRKTRAIAAIVLALLLAPVTWAEDDTTSECSIAPVLEQQTLFSSGDGNYFCYRIPAMVVTTRGTILAFAEGRKEQCSDHSNVDLVMKRSTDGGRTWSTMQVVSDDASHTMGNPCPVVERRSGTIWLPFCRTNKQILITKSTDDGRTWSQPLDITSQAADPVWHWFGTGPGHGIQLKSGRLVIPCWADATPRLGEIQMSYVFYSDDRGATWKRGAPLDANASDECECVELADGSLYLNARSRQAKKQRAYARSTDGGQSWSAVQFDPRMPEPSCQGGLVRFTGRRNFRRNRILLAAPSDPEARIRMTVRMSYDEAKTWPVAKLVAPGHSGYSDLAIVPDGHVLLLYEGHGAPAGASQLPGLVLARFNVEWLTGGTDHLQKNRRN